MGSPRRPKGEGRTSGTQFGLQQYQAFPDIDGHLQLAVQGINPGVQPPDLGHEFLLSPLQVDAQGVV